jgi:hypothetical protein
VELANWPASINDVVGLHLGSLPQKESRWIVNDVDVSEKWHIFKKASLERAKGEGLYVERDTQQILYASNFILLNFHGSLIAIGFFFT